jgi:hypothetical protein
MTSVQTIEARVSRRYVHAGGGNSGPAQWHDTVTVWTELGNWSMPYDAFVALFGICIAANTEGATVNIPSQSSGERKV